MINTEKPGTGAWANQEAINGMHRLQQSMQDQANNRPRHTYVNGSDPGTSVLGWIVRIVVWLIIGVFLVRWLTGLPT
jgi:hypothetical protein